MDSATHDHVPDGDSSGQEARWGGADTSLKFGFANTGGGIPSGSFELSASDAPQVFVVEPGKAFSVTETDPRPKGYLLTGAQCLPTAQRFEQRKNTNNPEDLTASVTPAGGEDWTCTFTNTKLTSAIEVVKSPKTQSVYAGDTATYTYKVTNTGLLGSVERHHRR